MTKPHYLTNVPEKEFFYVKDGTVVRNLFELARALSTMKPATFKYHVSREKNDFSSWVMHCVKDKKLGEQMARLVMKDKIELLISRKLMTILKQ